MTVPLHVQPPALSYIYSTIWWPVLTYCSPLCPHICSTSALHKLELFRLITANMFCLCIYPNYLLQPLYLQHFGTHLDTPNILLQTSLCILPLPVPPYLKTPHITTQYSTKDSLHFTSLHFTSLHFTSLFSQYLSAVICLNSLHSTEIFVYCHIIASLPVSTELRGQLFGGTHLHGDHPVKPVLLRHSSPSTIMLAAFGFVTS